MAGEVGQERGREEAGRRGGRAAGLSGRALRARFHGASPGAPGCYPPHHTHGTALLPRAAAALEMRRGGSRREPALSPAPAPRRPARGLRFAAGSPARSLRGDIRPTAERKGREGHVWLLSRNFAPSRRAAPHFSDCDVPTRSGSHCLGFGAWLVRLTWRQSVGYNGGVPQKPTRNRGLKRRW
jgi:hypothetical protein